MTDAIFGASGFIGGHLAKRLPDAIHVRTHAVDPGPIDRCFYLGAYGNMGFHDDAEEMVLANVGRAFRQARVSDYFLYASSSSVLLPVQTPYSRTKRAAEEILLALGKPCAIVRLFSVIGRSEQSTHLIPSLIRSCFEHERIRFVPTPTHDFIDVDDVVNDLMVMAEGRLSGVFEVGNGRSISNMEVLETVERISGRKANTVFDTSMERIYDNPNWCSKSEFTMRVLPRKSFEQSIEEMIEDYKTDPSKYAA